MYASLSEFLSRWKSVHKRTARLLLLIPQGKLEWRPAVDAFSFGDLIRHLAGIERYMFIELTTGGQNRYPGHREDLAEGMEAVTRYYETLHLESVELLKTLSDSALSEKCRTPAGASITTWKWLRAMLEHESHHRGQLYLMLTMNGVETPPLFGLTSEEVWQNSQEG